MSGEKATIPEEFAEVLSAFLEDERVRHRSALTRDRKRTQLGIFFRWLMARGTPDLAKVREADLVEYLAGRCVGRAGVADAASCLRTFFRFLRHERNYPQDPGAGLETPGPRRRLPRDVMTYAEVRRFLEAVRPRRVEGLRDRAILELLYSSGLRRSEVVNLNLGEVDLVSRTVFVRDGKGGKDRVVPVGKTAAEWLARYLEVGRPRIDPPPEVEAVFVSLLRHRISPTVVDGAVRKARKWAGITRKVTPHSLRATCASHLLWEGANLREIAEFLGHNRVYSTARYCAPGERRELDSRVVDPGTSEEREA